MFRRRPPTSADAQTPPLLSQRDRNEIEGTTRTDAQTPPPRPPGHLNDIRGKAEDAWNTISSPRLFYRWLLHTARTALREKGSEKRGPGTKHLSRRSKLAISMLIDMIGFCLFFLPVIGAVCEYNPFALGICVESPKTSNRTNELLLAVQNVICPSQLYEVQATVFSLSDLEVQLTLCRRNLGSERHRHAIGYPVNSGLTRWRMVV